MAQFADSIQASVGLLRAHRSFEELAQSGDRYGLYAKLSLARGGLYELPISRQELAQICVQNVAQAVRQKIGESSRSNGMITAGTLSFDLLHESEEYLLSPVGSAATPLVIDGETISVHYSGDQRSIPKLPEHLARAATKLLKHVDELPERMIGFSSRDVISVVARNYGLPTYRVDGYDGDSVEEIFIAADSARLARGRRQCPDRRVYALTMETAEFIDRFRLPGKF